MANEVLNALFTAKETISGALGRAEQATESFDNTLTELQVGMANVGAGTDTWSLELESLFQNTMEAREGASLLDRSIDKLDRSFLKLAGGSETTESQINDFKRAMQRANLASEIAEDKLDGVSWSFRQLGVAGKISGETIDNFNNKITALRGASNLASEGIDEINQSMIKLFGAAKTSDMALSAFNREVRETAISASTASTQLGILGAIAESTSFRFSSLSVNIGPFNLALRNILVQLPAILTGMGTLLAIVTALATAFLTLAAGLGAIVGAGALAWFQEFNKDFEETAEAAEALMSALIDLFSEALEPLMDEANMDLFIDSIDYAARLVNRFAQFFAQMKDDILAFTSGVGADIDILFEALHDNFVMMTPILQDVLNWFIEGFPGALMTFTRMTESIADAVGLLAATFGNLFFELLEFAELLINSVGPVLAAVIQVIADLFDMLNKLNEGIVSGILKWTAMIAAFTKLFSVAKSVAGVFGILHGVFLQVAASGGTLASAYFSVAQALNLATLETVTFSEAMQLLRNQLLLNIKVTRISIANKWKSIKASLANIKMLITEASAYFGLTAAIGAATTATIAFYTALTIGLIPIIGALIGVVGNILSSFLGFASIGSMIGELIGFLIDMFKGLQKVIATLLVPIINVALIPFQIMGQAIGNMIDKVSSLIDIFKSFMGVGQDLKGQNIFDGILKAIDESTKLAETLINWINKIPGMDIEGPALSAADVRSNIEGESEEQDKDDISTTSDVNLSFEESLEQNVDVQADPEDKAQLSRITKDAIAEANSLARRQQGGQ